MLHEEGVRFVMTLNEPNVYASMAYLIGTWPPQKNNPFLYAAVLRNMVKAHKATFEIIKKNNPGINVGIAQNLTYFEAKGIINKVAKKLVDGPSNFSFLDKIKDHQDFIGINHYFHRGLGLPKGEVSDLGWKISPKSLYFSLKEASKYNKPIYITENGVADSRDAIRPGFIQDSLMSVKKAIDEGIEVKGYFHWSLIDNFEWADGFWPRFGLVEVDYKTQKRKIRKSALIYKKVIKEGL
jgi:beta-glucosidase